MTISLPDADWRVRPGLDGLLAALGAVFGLGGVSGAYMVGFIVPNLFRRLFGEGALSAAFIPVYADLLGKDFVTAYTIMRRHELARFRAHITDWESSEYLELY
mgnify:CR=1 FL=1